MWEEFESDCESEWDEFNTRSSLEEFNRKLADHDARARERKAKQRVLIEKTYKEDPENWRHYNLILNESPKLLALLLNRVDSLKRRY